MKIDNIKASYCLLYLLLKQLPPQVQHSLLPDYLQRSPANTGRCLRQDHLPIIYLQNTPLRKHMQVGKNLMKMI